jgi:hypothetical protein
MLLDDTRKGLEMYEQFSSDGLTPLGIEEMHGLVATALHKYLDSYPEDRPLPDPLA